MGPQWLQDHQAQLGLQADLGANASPASGDHTRLGPCRVGTGAPLLGEPNGVGEKSRPQRVGDRTRQLSEDRGMRQGAWALSLGGS